MIPVDWLSRPPLRLLLSAALVLVMAAAATAASPALAGTGADAAHHCRKMPERHLVLDGDPTAAQPGAAQGDATDYPLGVGDTVRIRVFGREDLSGEFRVMTDGTITVPLLGALPVAGQTRAEAKAALTKAMAHASVQPTDISLEIARWRPLYVVGGVDEPGAFAFEPGMTVLHAVAVAGGFYRPNTFANLVVDSSRAQKELQQAELELMQALARRARLEAEIEDRKRAELPEGVGQFMSQAARERLMTAENRILKRRRLSHRTQEASLRKQISHTSSERAAYQQQLANVEEQIDLTHQELDRIRNLAERGLTPEIRILQLKRRVAELESDRREIVAEVSRSQRDLVVTEREHARLEIERLLEIERQLQEADEAVLRAQQAKIAAEALLRQLTSLGSETLKTRLQPTATYKIMRSIEGEQVTFYAPETAPLCAGDVINVLLDRPPGQSSQREESSSLRISQEQR